MIVGGLLDGVAKASACAESRPLAGGDVDRIASAGVTPGACLCGIYLERAESGEPNLIAVGELGGNRVKRSIQSSVRLRLIEARLLCDSVGQIVFSNNHSLSPIQFFSVEHSIAAFAPW
jgi:uncharacterized protein YqfA (UPF0365 family)